VFLANGYDYCPHETIQIAHNDANHWLLLSSINGKIRIYDSLNTTPTSSLEKQMKQLFSTDNDLPNYERVPCHRQSGGTDCGLFAIAYAIDLLLGNNPSTIIYDQSKFRNHLLSCLEGNEIFPFPKYQINVTSNQKGEVIKNSSWVFPRKTVKKQNISCENISVPILLSSNKFELLDEDQITNSPIDFEIIPNTTIIEKGTTNQFNEKSSIYNISDTSLTHSEKSVLEKGLNFCPSTKDLNKLRLMEDTYKFCRKMRLREYFYKDETTLTTTEVSPDNSTIDRCNMKHQFKNPYFQPPKTQSET